MKAPPVYTPIQGLGTGWTSLHVASRNRLFQGADHLMLVRSTGFTEDYRRVYFRDVTYVLVRQTRRREVLSLILGALVLLSLLLAIENRIAAAICAVPLLILLAVNLAKGPTCRCQLRTRVQTLDLPTPRRLARVPTLIEFLRGRTTTAS